MPPGEPHRYGADDERPWTIRWFHVMGGDVPPLLEEMGVAAGSWVVHLGDDPRLSALFEEELELMEHGYAPFQMLHASRTLGYLISLMACRARQNWRHEPDARQRITYCMAYMKQNLDKPLDLDTISGIACLSPSYLNVLFRKETGHTCMEYLTQLRIHQACQWLDATDWPVKRIAARLGFEDPLYFSRVFKSARGMSPRDFRRTHKA